MIPIALFKKFLSLQFIASVEVSNIARCKYMHHGKGSEEHSHQEMEKMTISRLKSSHLSYILVESMPFVMNKSKSEMGLSIRRIRINQLKRSGVYLTYHLCKIRIINIKQVI